MKHLSSFPAILLLCVILFGCKQDKKSSPAHETSAPAPGQEPISTISLNEVWSTSKTVMKTPESVLHDKKGGRYFVSCIGEVPPTAEDGDGYITVLGEQGNVLNEKWATGLDAPKGMGIHGNELFVTDINELAILDLKTGKIKEKIKIDGSVFLNDIAVSPLGVVYFTDMGTNTIYSYQNGGVSTFLKSNDLGNINGIYVDHETIYASSSSGAVNTIDRDSKTITTRAEGIINGDGIEPWKGGFVVSNWAGEIWYVSSTWKPSKIMDTKDEKINTADITINQKTGQLLVPSFFDNRVIAYDIK